MTNRDDFLFTWVPKLDRRQQPYGRAIPQGSRRAADQLRRRTRGKERDTAGNAAVTIDDAVHALVAALNGAQARSFHVFLVGYFIEGQPYAADALTMDGDSTLNVCATEDGVSCLAFFPPDRLAPETVSACGVQSRPDGTPFVPVRLEAKRQDIWLIAERVGGTAQKWYCEPEVLARRKLAFLREQNAWLQHTRLIVREHA